MDNNNYNNNQSSDSFYSYNNQQTQNSEQNQQSENTSGETTNQTGTYGQSSTYSSQAGSGYGQTGNTYGQSNSYSNQTGSGYGQTGSTYGQSSQTGNAYGQSGQAGNTYGQSNTYGASQTGNTYGQGNTYQSNTYGYQGGYGSNGTYQQGMYQNNTNGTKKEKKKKDKKPGNFGTKLAKCAALALVFGLVAGVAFEGVRLVSANLFGDTETVAEASGSVLNQSSGVQPTSVSSTYVATDVSDVVDQVMPSIVAITNITLTEYRNFWNGGTQTYESASAGSGIIVSQNDDYLYIVTNNHVVDGATSLTVAFSDNSMADAEIKGTDPSTDLAVIRVALDSVEAETLANIKVATLGNSDNLKVGEASIAIGNALGYGQSVTTGCISALNREVSVSDSSSGTNYTAQLIQTDAAINPGNSGGALLNAQGEVIGINSVKYSDTSVEGIGYAIPISTAMPIIEDLITKEKVAESEQGALGIMGRTVTDEMINYFNWPAGVYVDQTTQGSGAEKAGIKQGDIITALDGKEVSSIEELQTRLQYYTAGTTVDVTIKRASDGEYVEQVISVTLGKKS